MRWKGSGITTHALHAILRWEGKVEIMQQV